MKQIRFKCKKDGYKVVTDPKTGKKKCVKMSPEEIRKRQIAAKKAAIKRKSKLLDIIKKMKKTRLKNQQKQVKRIVKELP
jgi:hypothetical protein